MLILSAEFIITVLKNILLRKKVIGSTNASGHGLPNKFLVRTIKFFLSALKFEIRIQIVKLIKISLFLMESNRREKEYVYSTILCILTFIECNFFEPMSTTMKLQHLWEDASLYSALLAGSLRAPADERDNVM